MHAGDPNSGPYADKTSTTNGAISPTPIPYTVCIQTCARTLTYAGACGGLESTRDPPAPASRVEKVFSSVKAIEILKINNTKSIL